MKWVLMFLIVAFVGLLVWHDCDNHSLIQEGKRLRKECGREVAFVKGRQTLGAPRVFCNALPEDGNIPDRCQPLKEFCDRITGTQGE